MKKIEKLIELPIQTYQSSQTTGTARQIPNSALFLANPNEEMLMKKINEIIERLNNEN